MEQEKPNQQAAPAGTAAQQELRKELSSRPNMTAEQYAASVDIAKASSDMDTYLDAQDAGIKYPEETKIAQTDKGTKEKPGA